MKKPANPRDDLGQELERALERDAKFMPECDPAEYTTNVYYSVLVSDCDNITAAEKREMSDGLVRAGKSSAGAICELNANCPKPQLLRYRFERIECYNRLWEVDLKWHFKCKA